MKKSQNYSKLDYRFVLSNATVQKLNINVLLNVADPYFAAINYGAINGLVGTVIAATSQLFKNVKRVSVDISPSDFTNRFKINFSGVVSVPIRCLVLFFLKWLLALIKQNGR